MENIREYDEFKYEFDIYPESKWTVSCTETDFGASIVLTVDGEEEILFDAVRDQWGVFVMFGERCIAQEDGTRSFLDGLIKSLQHLCSNVEDCTESTLVCESNEMVEAQ